MGGHIPVLLDECIKYLNIKPDGVYVDGTLGMGCLLYTSNTRVRAAR